MHSEDWNKYSRDFLEHEGSSRIDWMKDWVFRTEVVRNWVVHRILLDIPIYACSTSGHILQLGRYISERIRDDEVATDGELYTFDPAKSPFEKQRSVYLTRVNSYRFFDVETGLIRLGLEDALDNDEYRDVSYWRASNSMISNFVGWAVCFSNSDLPNSASDFLDFSGYHELAKTSHGAAPKRRRGRPSQRETAARHYFLAFPNGHEKEGKTWKEALQKVNQHLPRAISEDTLRRALDGGAQNPQ